MKSVTTLKMVLALVLSLFSWQMVNAQKNAVGGNGDVIERPISVDDFVNIDFDANANLYYELRPDTASSFRMEIDENLVSFVEVEVKKKKLVIKTSSPIKPTKFIIYVNSRAIKDINMIGAGSVFVDKTLNTKDLNVNLKGFGNFNAEKLLVKSLSIDVSGAGGAMLKGTAQSLNLKIGKNGSGSVDSEGLDAENVSCSIQGSGNISVKVSKSLSVDISGSGDVLYKGSPRNFSHKLKGVGSVKQNMAE